MGYTAPWYSDAHLDDPTVGVAGRISCYLRREDKIYRTYWTTGRGDEMKASLDALDAFLASIGWHLEDVYPDPIRGEPHFAYSVVSKRPDSDDAEMSDCDLRTYRFVEIFAPTTQGPGPMDPALRARTHTCLDDTGVPTSSGGVDVQDRRTDVFAAATWPAELVELP
jgi:hypothetical protein